jgi:sugar lactone lactonase YvrE
VWLKGEKAGEAEIFVDNLPGNPDNIRLGSDGHFWIALPQVSHPFCHQLPWRERKMNKPNKTTMKKIQCSNCR